eukprot:jgi/Phyca11/19322/fgenesh1_pg.PHYCAscaffold_47_\
MSDSAVALWESELLRAREWLAATRTDKQQEHAQLFTRIRAHIAYKDHQRSLQSEVIASEDEDDTALDFLADVDASDMSALLQAEAAKAAPGVEDMPPPVETTMPSAKDLMKPLDMPNNLASPKLKPKAKAVPMSQLDPKTLGSSTTASVTAGATLGAEEDVQKLMQASSKSPQDPHKKKAAIPEEQRQVLMKTKQLARDSDSESEDDFSSDYSPAEDDEMPEPDEPEVVDLLSDDYLDSDEDKRPAKRKRKRLRQTNMTAKTKKVRSRKPAVTRKLSQPDSSSESTPPPSSMEVNESRALKIVVNMNSMVKSQ